MIAPDACPGKGNSEIAVAGRKLAEFVNEIRIDPAAAKCRFAIRDR
jgi:hypothetical protein